MDDDPKLTKQDIQDAVRNGIVDAVSRLIGIGFGFLIVIDLVIDLSSNSEHRQIAWWNLQVLAGIGVGMMLFAYVMQKLSQKLSERWWRILSDVVLVGLFVGCFVEACRYATDWMDWLVTGGILWGGIMIVRSLQEKRSRTSSDAITKPVK